MIPQFPTFERLSLEHRGQLEEMTAAFDPYSDLSFTSLYGWNVTGQTRVSQLDGALVLQMSDYVDPSTTLMTCLPTRNHTSVVTAVLDYIQTEGIAQELTLIPREVADQLPEDTFEVAQDHRHHDYVLSLEEHALLSGAKYKKRRNMVKQFLIGTKDNDTTFRIHVGPLCKAEQKDMLGLFDTWAMAHSAPKETFAEEREALIRTFDCMGTGHYMTSFISVDGILQGFSLLEQLSETYAIVHFSKATRRYTGIGEYMLQQEAQYLEDSGYIYFNIEQDIGILGLRTNKQLKRPVHLLHKYIIRPV